MKITIAFVALLAIIANVAGEFDEIAPAYDEIQPIEVATGRQSVALVINRIRKEIKGLIEEFEQCNSYESDALKGTCFTHWSLRLVSDIKQFIETIKNWSDEELPETRSSTAILINKIRKEIKGLIEEFEQCNAYESDALKGTCFTHWSLRLVNDIKQLVEYFIDNSGDELAESRSSASIIIAVNKLRKEIEGLIEEFEQCNSYESDALKGTCFTHWSLRLVSDIKQLVEGIIELANGGNRSTRNFVHIVALITQDVKELIELYNECDSYFLSAKKGVCFTRWALLLIKDLTELIQEIINSDPSRMVQYEADIEKLVEDIIELGNGDYRSTRNFVHIVALITQDVKELIELYNECDSYFLSAKKGVCFTRWALLLIKDLTELIQEIINSDPSRLVQYEADIEQIVEGIIEFSNSDNRSNKNFLHIVALITQDVKELIELYNECDSYFLSAKKGVCFTRWALLLIKDLTELIQEIINSDPSRMVPYETAYMQDYYEVRN